MRVLVNGSFNQTTAIRIAKTELVSRSAAAGATGAWLQTQRIRRYDAIAATAVGRAVTQRPRISDQAAVVWRCRRHIAAALVIETTKP